VTRWQRWRRRGRGRKRKEEGGRRSCTFVKI
jgi:hypothetical protein